MASNVVLRSGPSLQHPLRFSLRCQARPQLLSAAASAVLSSKSSNRLVFSYHTPRSRGSKNASWPSAPRDGFKFKERTNASRNPSGHRPTPAPTPAPTTPSSISHQNITEMAPNHSQATSMPTETPRFADLEKEKLLHPVLLRTLTEDMKFNHMTPVQAATLRPLLKDRSDMLAQAKTGTGKTIAFLVPAIQNLINQKASPGRNISLLVISPTRELAMQIAVEARTLLQNLPKYKVCIAIGGTNKTKEENLILKGCDILIGTPGRLYDHLGEEGKIAGKLQSLSTLVLDEADRLLDMGFLDTLKNIISFLPDKEASKRQGVLFSATVPGHVEKVSRLVLSKDYKAISTIAEGEVNIHQRVPQNLVVVPTFSDTAAALLGALRQEIALCGPNAFKAIVFIPAARLVDFYAKVLGRSAGLPPVISIHSRMAQTRRTKITEEFRQAQSSILVATDVIARGMDFPSVTNVFQVGIPADKESYIHRLGRTARAGAEGRGTLIITSHETFFPKKKLSDIAFEKTAADLSAQKEVLRIAETFEHAEHGHIYLGWLGFYNQYRKPMGWDTTRLVKEANEFVLKGLGASEIPALLKATVGKMGLKGVQGLVIGPSTAWETPTSSGER